MLEPQEGLTGKEVIEAAKSAEELGFGYLFRSDHLLPTSGRRGIYSAECWTTLAAIAATTSKIKFGPLVSPVGFRNPVLLCLMASTVNSLSGNRLQLGLGAGWYIDEYEATGIDFPSFRTRREQLLEAVKIIRSLIKDEYVEMKGRYYSAKIKAKIDGRDMAIIIGGKSTSLVRTLSQYADEWNLLSPSKEELIKIRSELHNSIPISQMGPFFIADSEAEIREKVAGRMKKLGVDMTIDDYINRLRKRNAIIGTPEKFAEELNERISWGIDKFYFQTLEPEDKESLAMLADCLKSI